MWCESSSAPITNATISEFQEAFQLFDSRGDGKIHVTDWRRASSSWSKSYRVRCEKVHPTTQAR